MSGARRGRRPSPQQALVAAGIGVWSMDLRSQAVHWDETTEALFGFSPGTFPGTQAALLERIHPDDLQAVLAAHQRSIESGGSFSHEHRVRWPDGSVHWLTFTGRAQLDAAGKAISLGGVVIDITDRREQETRRTEGHLHQLADLIPQIVWVADEQGQVREFNRRWYEYTGLPDGLTSFDSWTSVVHPDDLPRLLDALREPGQSVVHEFRLRRHDGAYRWHLGRMISAGLRFGTATDIHDQKLDGDRQQFLSEAATLLTARQETATRYQRVARLGQRLFNGACVLWLSRFGEPMPVAVAHHTESCEPELPVHAFRALKQVSGVLATGEPCLQSGAEHAFDLPYALHLPLRAVGPWFGVLTVGSETELSPLDMAFCEEFANRVAWALEHARLNKEQEEALALLETLLQNAPVGMAFLDRQLRYVRMNPKLASFNGLSPEQAVGKTAAEMGHILGDAIVPVMKRVIATGEPVLNVELDGPPAPLSHQPRTWLASYYPVRSPESGEEVLGLGAVVIEITNQKAEHARLEEAVRARDEFLATVSHELRTPLTAILGYASMLRTGALPPPKASRALETIERNARAQARLVEDILDASRIITGKMVLHVRPLSPRQIVEAALESVRPAAAAKEIQLDTELICAIESIVADPDRLQQVVWNLLSNAIKFTRVRGRVRVRLFEREGQLGLSVSDDGEGITASFLPHVFERFRQQDSSTTRSHGGLGLGLAIVKHLVELHGGTVSAHSAGPGSGATFTVTLPLSAARTDSPLQGARVLLVAPDAERCRNLTELLLTQQARVRAVKSEAEALTELEREELDLVVTSESAAVRLDTLVRKLRAMPAPPVVRDDRATPVTALLARLASALVTRA